MVNITKAQVDKHIESTILSNGIQNTGYMNNNFIATKDTKDLVSSAKDQVASITSEVSSVAASQDVAYTQAAINLSAKYSSGRGRLVNFTYTDGSDDDSRRAYMKLQGEVASFANTMAGEDQTLLEAIYNHLIDGYTSIIILQVQENLQEKQSIMPTTGDSFALTFSGAEPQVLVISGYLPFDGDKDNSWFTAFVNAYKHFIRASKLAKYRCSLKLVFPDFSSYTCYPVSFNAGLSSEQDNVIAYSLSAIVVENPTNKAYTQAASVSAPTNTVEEVQEATSETTLEEEKEAGVTKSPAEIGETEQKKSWVESVSDWVNNVSNSKTMQTINKTFAVTNQVMGAIDAISGKPYGERYYSGKIGRGTYD